MQRLLYSVLSISIMLVLLAFALPFFLIVAAVIIVFILIGMFTGRASFTVHRSGPTPRPPDEAPRPRVDKGVIDITEDQEKK